MIIDCDAQLSPGKHTVCITIPMCQAKFDSFDNPTLDPFETLVIDMDRVPRWNDQVIIDGHRYRVTSSRKISSDDLTMYAVMAHLQLCRDTYEKEMTALHEATLCKDCGNECLSDMFMVHDELWEKHARHDELLCQDCFETRLGRTLAPEDFTDAPINRIKATNF